MINQLKGIFKCKPEDGKSGTEPIPFAKMHNKQV